MSLNPFLWSSSELLHPSWSISTLSLLVFAALQHVLPSISPLFHVWLRVVLSWALTISHFRKYDSQKRHITNEIQNKNLGAFFYFATIEAYQTS
ncbi:hypothetical protein PHYBLDRAFT_144137 [Phycomyces blakesleeanus NRRL 1555(-)]|uniref:Uncharacterized protein n=1 Tax=Phycomyces blakesleeanus (strain ATCC 8743b / DSM 1359 / FGSC 10004 / NBRC 33097 / NRRL 1555) TaxID=763407 RepID=A0A167N232_PHYB8|nr:hypothetical protein PHYBLDRAFT_144137 [Phycomyces blakesleeanus NRRL 1555(-)]OAD74774.1 hypothetical protein PHYBLDRAFT_144137 [Phycomyces blakesleeanus NRRL 1555(-)]|eukprot:XP_018292814.1 hypothetical protein PHYBLDRAFT_144137 [Phycomyces blakesleeanus NRRL 1555(-)]